VNSGMILALLSTAAFANDITPPRQETAETKELQSRVDEYLKLRKQAVEHVPKLKIKAEPQELQAHKRGQLEALRTALSGAKQGDILTPAVQRYLKDVIRTEVKGRAGRAVKDSTKAGNPATEGSSKSVPLEVNAPYPDSAPLSTVPPTLLLRLPTLPKELDFRFVGRHLVLHDVQSGMIVDFILNAMP